MGLKIKSNHFYNKTSGGESKRNLNSFKLNIQLFSSKIPDKKMSGRGLLLYNMAKNQSLKNHIVELYRPGATIGDGGTADALRYEVYNGVSLHGKSHYLKAIERVRALEKLYKQNLSSKDQKIIRYLINDLNDAICIRRKYDSKRTK